MVSIELHKANEWLEQEESAYSNKRFTEAIEESFRGEGINAYEKNLKDLSHYTSTVNRLESYINAAFDFRNSIHLMKRECYKNYDYIKSIVFYADSIAITNSENKCNAIERRIYYKVRQ